MSPAEPRKVTVTAFLVVGASRMLAGLRTRAGQWLTLAESSALEEGGISSGLSPLAATTQSALSASMQLEVALETEEGRWRCDGLQVLVSDVWLDSVRMPWQPEFSQSDALIRQAHECLAGAGVDVIPENIVRIDDGGYAQPRLVVSFPSTLMDELASIAQRLGTSLRSVQSLSAVAWRQSVQRRYRAVALLEDGAVTLAWGDGRVEDVNAWVHGPELTSVKALSLHWQRLLFREPWVASDGAIPMVDIRKEPDDLPSGFESSQQTPLSKPSSKHPHDRPVSPRALEMAACMRVGASLDAVQNVPTRKPIWLSFAAFASVLVAAVLVLQAWQAHGELDRQRRMSVMEQPSAQAANAVPARAELARVQAVNAAVRELNWPVEALLSAVHPPRDIGVRVMQVDLRPATAADGGEVPVKLTAEAKMPAEMFRYGAYLSGKVPFVRAELAQHELMERPDGRVYRFTVEAAWRP